MLGFLQAGLLSTVSSRCNSTMYKKREAFSVRCFYALSIKHSVCSLGWGMQRCPLISVCLLCKSSSRWRTLSSETAIHIQERDGMIPFSTIRHKSCLHTLKCAAVSEQPRERGGDGSLSAECLRLWNERFLHAAPPSLKPIPHYGVSDNAAAGPMAGDRTRARVFLTSLNQLNSLKYAIIWHFLCCCRNEFLLVELGPSRVPSDLVMT